MGQRLRPPGERERPPYSPRAKVLPTLPSLDHSRMSLSMHPLFHFKVLGYCNAFEFNGIIRAQLGRLLKDLTM